MRQFLPSPKQKHALFAHVLLLLLAMLFLFAGNVMAQAPAVSYISSHGYATGSPIIPLSPANTGGPVAVTYNGTPRVISFAYSNTQQLALNIALDHSGDIFVADFANGKQILEYNGGPIIQVADGFTSPRGLAIDRAGNIFFTDRTVLYKMAPGESPVVIGHFVDANSVAVDKQGNLYVADDGNFTSSFGGVYKMDNDGSNMVKIDNGLQAPSFLAVDSSANVFVSDILDRAVYKIAASNGQQTALATFTNAIYITTDPGGNLYVGDNSDNNIYFISAGSISSGNIVTQQIGNVAGSMGGLAVDTANNLYVLRVNSSHLNEVDIYGRTGGYSVSPALPAGIALDNNTGIISGTPTLASPATAYTVTALNAGGSNTANLTVQVGPAPVISYGAAQAYGQKTAISPLTPSNTGAVVTVAGYSAAPSPVAAGLNIPVGVSADAAGNIYVSDKGSNAIKEITPSGGNPAILGSGYNAPAGIVADDAGNVYVADSGNGAVEEIPAGNGAVQTIVTGLTEPQAITRDLTGNLFVANAAAIYEIASGQNTAVTLVSGFNNLTGIAVDGNGNLYVASAGTGKVYKIKIGNNTPVDMGVSLTAPAGIAVDRAGNLFITDSGTHTLYEVAAGSSTAVALTMSFNAPAGVAVSRAGKLYVTDAGAGQVFELSPAGGFYLNKPLPEGLTMDATTGAISGTPKTQSAATNYTVTAYAGLVSASASLTISVGPPLAAPAISYQSPPAYLLGASIAPLLPSNSGGTVAAPAWGAPAPFGPNLEGVDGMALDSHGNLFATTSDNTGITEVPAGGGLPIIYAGTMACTSVAVDSTGNIYFVSRGALYHAVRGNTSFTEPFGPQNQLLHLINVAIDPAGNIYAYGGDDDDVAIYKIPAAGSNVATLESQHIGANMQSGFTVDAFGNVYFGNLVSHTLNEIPAGTTNMVTLVTGVDPWALAVDNAGNIYDADKSIVINFIASGSGTATQVAVAVGHGGIVVDAVGNLSIGTGGESQFYKLTPTGGYFISRWLPQGLSMSSITGTISGTPTTASAAATYTVTSWNSSGSGSANVILATGIPPVISYAGPQAYSVGTAISALSPTNSGAAVTAAGYNNSPLVFFSGLGSPRQIASDAAGNIYAADKTKNMITKIPAGGGPGVCVGASFNSPGGVAVDKAGNIYIADAGNAAVKEIPAAGGFITTIGSGFTAPAGVAVDTLGNVYVADGSAVYKVTPGGVKTTVVSGFTTLTAMVISPNNKSLFVADGSGMAYKILISSSPAEAVQLGGGFTSPAGIAMDNTGNLFVTDAGTRQIYEIANGQTQAVSLGLSLSPSSSPAGLIIDDSGNIYFADAGTGQVNKITPSGGYYLNEALPEGLLMDNGTGTISGTPKSASLAASYTITAYAGGVSGRATVNITVNNMLPPAFGYNGMLSLSNGIPLVPVAPTFTSGSVGQYAYNGTPVIIGAGVTAFGKIYVDSEDNILVADKLDGAVTEIFGSNNQVLRQQSFLHLPDGITQEHLNGQIWVADGQNVQRLNLGYQAATPIDPGSFQTPVAIGCDAAGYIYVGDTGLGGIYRMNNDGSNIVKIDHGISHPDALVADAAGNVFAVNSVTDSLYEIQASNGAQIRIAAFNTPTDVAIDLQGNIYVAESAGYVYFIPSGGGTPLRLNQTPYANITGIAVDYKGTLFVGQSSISGVNKLTPTGGYFPASELPAGVKFDPVTGVISGTPVALNFVQPSYTVNGYNAFGSGSATVVFQPGGAPALSYASPQAWYKGVTGPPVSPVNTGVAVSGWGYSNRGRRVFAESFNTGGIAADQDGNVYVTDIDDNMLIKYPRGGSAECVGTGFNNPQGIAFDGVGNLYIADEGNAVVKMIPAGGGIIKTIGSGFSTPSAIATDISGNIYVGDAGNIYKIAAGSGVKSQVTAVTFTITGIAVDLFGNIYVAGGFISPVIKIPAGTSSQVRLNTIQSGDFVATDPMGNLFVFVRQGFIVEVPAGTSTSLNTNISAIFADGFAIDATGNIYNTERYQANKGIYKTVPSGGYYLNRTLPPGLTLDQNSGIISGRPTVASAANDYMITAYATGIPSEPANLSIAVQIPSTDAMLSSLITSTGSLTPGFSPAGKNYSENVPSGTATITLAATPDDPNATVVATLNGSPVSWPATLGFGSNVFAITVTAQDQATINTYTVTITRPSANAKLARLTLSSGILSPAFAPAVNGYTATVANSVSSITVTPTGRDGNSAIMVNGNRVTSGVASANLPLALVPNTIAVVVTAQNGVTINTYTVVVTRLLPSNAGLDNLILTTAALKPAFSTSRINYSANVSVTTTMVNVTPLTSDAMAAVTVNGTVVPSGTASADIALAPGLNVISTKVTAQDGTTKTYTVHVFRNLSANAKLASLAVSAGKFSPKFSPDVSGYADSVSNDITSVSLMPITREPNATITVNGDSVLSGSTSSALPLNVGDNVITILVRAQNQTTTSSYTVSINRGPEPLNTVYQPVSVDKPIATTALNGDEILVHQGISPNGDGQNDVLTIDGISNYPDNKLSIMNRSGQLIYEAKGYDNTSKAFDGHSNKTGVKQLPGTYFYSLEYTVKGVVKRKAGFIVLKW